MAASTNHMRANTRVFVIVLAAVSVPIVLALLLVYRLVSVSVFAVGVSVWLCSFAVWAGVRVASMGRNGASRGGTGALSVPMNRESLLWQLRLKKVRVGWLILALPIIIWDGVGQRWWLLTIACVTINLLMLYLALRAVRNLKARLNVLGS